jgi:SAM-dependent methyltransferase
MALVASPSTARNVPDGPPFVLPGGAALQTAAVPSADEPATRLLRVTADDPEYRRLAAAEAAFWRQMHPMGLEATEHEYSDGPIDRYVNTRFTGDPNTDWVTTIPRWGTFRRGLLLGASSPPRESRVLELNPGVHVTLIDLSAGAAERRAAALAARFPGRVEPRTADLNFLELPAERYDLIVSSSTIHYVTNLEYLASQIDRALTPDGYFFLEDYVGEPRFGFSEQKRRLFEMLYDRNLGRQRGRRPGVLWHDASDLSPFCGVRSDEILDVFRTYLDEVQVRTAAALTLPMTRSRPADYDELVRRLPRWKVAYEKIAQRLRTRRPLLIRQELLDELCLVGDAACDAGLLRPGIAFAVYRERR